MNSVVGDNVRSEIELELKDIAIQDSLSKIGIDYELMSVEKITSAPEGYVTLDNNELIQRSSEITDIIMLDDGTVYYLLDGGNKDN